MQSSNRHQQFNTMPKQAGFIASVWLAINCGSLSYDRTPEITQGSREGEKIPRI
jgi:hypothetical protein